MRHLGLPTEAPEGRPARAPPWPHETEDRSQGASRIRRRLTFEVRVDATDDATWKKFRVYFAVIGPASRLIRVLLLRSLARELAAEQSDERRALPGDELMGAKEQATDAIVIDAPPESIWPWLVQMGCRRGGFYSYDLLDNGGHPSAREIHPELQAVQVGDVLPATPNDEGGFEVLRVDEGRVLVVGGLVDGDTGHGLPFGAPSPDRYWRATWAFVLEPIDAEHSRLVVRARVSFARQSLHLAWVRPVHHFMEAAQLRHLKERAEGRLARDTFRDVLEGIGGAAIVVADFLTPFMRDERSRWGLTEEEAQRARAGDELVPPLAGNGRTESRSSVPPPRYIRGSRRSALTERASTATNGSRTSQAASYATRRPFTPSGR